MIGEYPPASCQENKQKILPALRSAFLSRVEIVKWVFQLDAKVKKSDQW